MVDRFRISKGWALRFEAEKISVPLILRRAGLPANLFEQERIFVSTAEVFAIWRAVAELSPAPGLGLRLGTELRFERSHPVSIAGVCSRTFGDALQRLARYKQLTCPEEIRVQRRAKETSVEFFFSEAKEAQPAIMVDLGLSWIWCVGQRGSDGQITPLRLELTRTVKHRGLLEKHFGCRVHFNAVRNALVYRNGDLDLPFVTRNDELLRIVGAHLDSELKTGNAVGKVEQQVKDVLKRSLAGKRPALQDVGQELGLSKRTLQRRLTEAGVTFQQLLEETRRELARRYLLESAVELPEAAFLLGFEDVNSFFRAFQGWEGTSPTEWRNRHVANAR